MMDKFERALQEGKFEQTELGLFFPSERAIVAGVFHYNKRGEPEEMSENLVVTEGLNRLITNGITSNPWYIALWGTDTTVQAGWTAANFAANSGEITTYAGDRKVWTAGAVAAGAVNSFASKASFEATSDGVVIRGAAMLTSLTKGGTAGSLLGASRFTSAKTLDTGEILDVGYGIQITPVT
jgi:hypothetical protein